LKPDVPFENEDSLVPVKVKPCPADAPRALAGVGRGDELWDLVYEKVYGRLCRSRPGGTTWPHPISHRAALMADYALWMMVPAGERPEGWPRDIRTFANSVGSSVVAVRNTANQVRLHTLLEKGPFDATARIVELKRVLYDRAMADLQGDGKSPTRAAEVYLKAEGVLKGPGMAVNVHVGNKTSTLNIVQGGSEEFDARIRRLAEESLRYLARKAGTQEVRDAEVVGSEVPVEAEEVQRGVGVEAPLAGEPSDAGDRHAS